MASLVEFFVQNRNNTDTCLRFNNLNISYQSAYKNIAKMIEYFKKVGIKRGDVVTLAVPNTPQNICAFFALDALGAIINLVHPITKRKTLFRMMEEVKSHYLITSNYKIKKEDNKNIAIIVTNQFKFTHNILKYYYGLRIKHSNCYLLDDFMKEKAKDFIPFSRQANEDSIYLHSSGTTSEPKVVRLSNEALINMSHKLSFIAGNDLKGKYMLAVLPIFHSFGLAMGVVAPLLNSMPINLLMRFNAKTIAKEINKNNVHFIIGVPLMYEKLLKSKAFCKAKLKNVELCFMGGDACNTSLVNSFDALMAKHGSEAKLLEGYGLSEALICIVNTKFSSCINSLGKPLINNDIKIIDEYGKDLGVNKNGEIVVYADTLMNGYLNNDNNEFVIHKNSKGIKTGDIGFIDNKGFVHFVERKKRVYKISGVYVFPSEVEKIVKSLSYIKDVALLYCNAQKPYLTLFISLQKGVKESNEKIKENTNLLLSEHVIKYAMPKEIKLLKDLPKTSLGKIDFNKLNKYWN